MQKIALFFAFSLALAPALRAELTLPAIISDHMVLQQKQSNPIWGWDTPGTKIAVSFAGQTYSTTAGDDGKWTVKLAPLPANATPQTLTVVGSSRREIQDVLVGEVWMCSGQSNMQFHLFEDWNGDLEGAASTLPDIRLIEVPLFGTQELQKDMVLGATAPGNGQPSDYRGHWRAATPATAPRFSAVGFFFGRYLHEILNVPIGLIDNAWSASPAEAWVRRSSLEQDPRFKNLVDTTVKKERDLQSENGKVQQKADYEHSMRAWEAATEKAKAGGKELPNRPYPPEQWLVSQHRPGNIFAGVLYPTLGYGIKGVIWYQGEDNAARAYEHTSLFPFLIEQWRKEWGQGDFPFYWVQLPGYKAEQPTPRESAWAEFRESQTKTMQQLTNTGQAVTIDLGEGKNIHPKNKHDVAARLARWALVKDYGMKLSYRSPEFKSVAFNGNKATVTIECFGSSLRTFGVEEARGFAICGADKVWHWATGNIVGMNGVEVWSDEVAAPVAVRYAWADNPACNLFSNDGLPITPFRTDDSEMITKPKTKP